jgi:hypothetical protein
VAGRAVEGEGGDIATHELGGQAGTLPTEGFEVAWTSYTVACKRSTACLTVWMAIRALETGAIRTSVLTIETGAKPFKGSNVICAS